MKVLIIEDEAPAYRRLTKLIAECDSSIEIVGIIPSVKEGIEWFQKNTPPDLIFSDIQLADDLSFKIFRELKITIPIIFITAFDEYAINAFKFYSIDYLLKPISIDDLKASIDKYRDIHSRSSSENFDALLKKLAEKTYRERFLVYSGDTLIPLSCDNIAYFISEDGATIIVTKENKRYFIAESLDNLENELNSKLFFRANRQFILSLSSIHKIHNFGLQKLKITIKPDPEDEIIVSKLKATQFKNWLNC
jgi:two-component system, LytTR family, response regulator LytT